MSVEQMRGALTGLRWSEGYNEALNVALSGTRSVLALINLSERGPPSTLDPDLPVIPSDWTVGLWINLTAVFARLRPYFLSSD